MTAEAPAGNIALWLDGEVAAVMFARRQQRAERRVAVERGQADTGREAILDGDGRSFAAVRAERLGEDTDTDAAA